MGKYGDETVTRAVFLDRDGVINRSGINNGSPVPPKTIDEFVFLPGVAEALNKLKETGFILVVVTNQPDVNRRQQSKDTVEAMHQKIREDLVIDDIKVCYAASDEEADPRRKPAPGMLLEAAEEWNINLRKSYMVGDRWRDIDAGNAAGCKSIFIDHNYSEKKPDGYIFKTTSLEKAANFILKNN